MPRKTSDMVVKSNSLIEASYYLTLNELRLLDMALAKLTGLEENEKISASVDDAISIRASDYVKLYGVDINTAYDNLKSASKTLRGRYFTFKVPSKTFEGKVEKWSFNWVRGVGYVEGEGIVMLAFTPELTEMAGQLKSNFSRYHVQQKSSLSSMYAHRLYETMMQWRSTKTVPSISYKELRERFGITKKEYSTMSNFKRVVLHPAIKQINEHTDITISYEQYKEGRSVAGFIFKFKFKKERKNELKGVNKGKGASFTKPIIDNTKRTPQKIPAMSEKQRNTFANKMLNSFDFIRDYSAQTIGKSREELLLWVERGLIDDEQREEWRKYILLSGYKFPDRTKN